MATELAIQAAYRGLGQRLTGADARVTTIVPPLWSNRAYGTRADDKAERPYVVYSFAGGGQGDLPNEEVFVMDIVCVADSVDQSMVGAADIDELVNNQGVQDRGCDNPLIVGAVWQVRAITGEQIIHTPYLTQAGEVRYQTGKRYRFSMQLLP